MLILVIAVGERRDYGGVDKRVLRSPKFNC